VSCQNPAGKKKRAARELGVLRRIIYLLLVASRK